MRRLAVRLAAAAAVLASAAAVPFFLEQMSPYAFKLPTALKVACDSYRTGTANSLYIGDDTQIAYETVCGKKDLLTDESPPGTDRLLCQEFGSFPPTDQITSVCDLNYRYQNFLQCWGSGGLLTRLVENRRFVSYAAQSFGALQDLVSEQKDVLDSKDTSFLSCLTTDFDGGPADEALAYSLNTIIAEVVTVLASNNLAIRHDDVPVFSMASDPAFMCNGPLLVLNPDKKI